MSSFGIGSASSFGNALLLPFGQCLDGAGQVLDDGGDVKVVLAQCRARDYLTQAATCSQSILDMLYELSGFTVEGESRTRCVSNGTSTE
jgi:hypothetical protein